MRPAPSFIGGAGRRSPSTPPSARPIREYTDGYGATIIDKARDYLVHAADLVLGGERTLPLAGDTIEETDGGETLLYEVTALGPEPAYRYSDPARVRLRIHTKLSTTVNL